MTMNQPKLTRARRQYRCHLCGGAIEPGELYRRRTLTGGPAAAPTAELRDGYPTVVEHSFRVQVRVCQGCI